MPQLSVELNADAAIAAMQQAPGRTQRATVRALNRALTYGRAEMARRIAKDMGLRIGDAKEAVFVEKATASKLSVRLVASLRRRPLLDFQARQTARGVSFRDEGGKRTLREGAFIVGVQTGHAGTAHRGVFKRVGKTRLPIYELHGVSVGHVFNRHRPAVLDVMRESFDTNLAHELQFASTEDA